MNFVIKKIKEIIIEVKKFPIQNLSPSDDPDKATCYIHNFMDIIKRLEVWISRINDDEIKNKMKKFYYDPANISELYTLYSEISAEIEYLEYALLNNPSKFSEKKEVSPRVIGELKGHIIENMKMESAYELPYISEGYGLECGTEKEAFSSKRLYLSKRLAKLTDEELIKLAFKLKGKYQNSQFDTLIDEIYNIDSTSISTSFDNIRNMIINEIRNSHFLIWVAVAWFTDIEIARELFKKQKEGVDVQIIVNNDRINSKLIEKTEQYLKIYKIPSTTSYDKLMHHKFCIFDLKKVIHGSYNWTNKAQFNDETASLIIETSTTELFAEEFIKLKKNLLN